MQSLQHLLERIKDVHRAQVVLRETAEAYFATDRKAIIDHRQDFVQLLTISYVLNLPLLFSQAINERMPQVGITVFFDKHRSQPATELIWACSRTMHFFTFQICNDLNLARIVVDRWLSCIDLFNAVAAANGFEGDIRLNLDDGDASCGLTFCDSRQHDDTCLIPDSYFLGTRGYEDFRKVEYIPWHKRSDSLYWRGSSTGRAVSGVIPRVALCRIARDNPSLDIDAGLTEVFHDEAAIRAEGLMKDPVSWDIFYAYKYHIDIDGNSNSWPGLFTKLLSGGLVLKVASPSGFRQWYYDRLEPWINFVPVQSDFSDLAEVIQTCRADEEKSSKIAARGQKLAKDMTFEAELRFGASAVTSYCKRGGRQELL